MLIKIADTYLCNKKTYNNAISALRRAFDFGYLDHPERRDPAASLKCARIGKNDPSFRFDRRAGDAMSVVQLLTINHRKPGGLTPAG